MTAGGAGGGCSGTARADAGGARRGGPAPRRVLLVGMMGAGKTTVGTLLSRRLGWRYVDSDAEVEAMTGHTVKELFESGGEGAFRHLESRALVLALAGTERAVVSVAGGAVLDPANRELLRQGGTVVWLRAAAATLYGRVAGDLAGEPAGDGPLHDTGDAAGDGPPLVTVRPDHRPLLEHDPAGTIERLERERRPLYEEVADVVIDVDGLSPEDAARAVQAAIA